MRPARRALRGALLALVGALLLDCGASEGTTASSDAVAHEGSPAELSAPDAAPDPGSGDEADPIEAATSEAGRADAEATDSALAQACGSCHGLGDDPAPPPDLAGSSDPTAPGVGAHAAHLAPAGAFPAVRCKHCHVVPNRLDDPGHVDDARPADVTFSGLPTVGVEARYEGGACLVRCPGAALHEGPRWSPTWTAGAIACGDCHGMPPTPPHPLAADCGRCHLDVADASGAIVDPDLHGDSIVNAPHGAHMHHLGPPATADLACDDCHVVPAYHGSLKDGGDLQTTGLCDACHDASLDRSLWNTDPW